MFKRHKQIHRYFHEDHEQYCCYHEDFHLYHRYVKWGRFIAFLFNLSIVYLLLKWIGNQGIAIFFAVFISIKEIIQLSFLWRLEKRIFQPMDQLKDAVDEIAKGNYNVRVDGEITNEFGVLIHSFNAMAEKLKQSEKMKLAYEKNRKDLIANISHDLKTPIASIQGYIEAILDGVVTSPEKNSKYLKIIQHNATYINKLIDDLFLFSKLDMEKLDFQYQDIQIRSYMDDLMEEFQYELEERRIEFKYMDRMESNYVVQLDGKRIQQAIRNIIGNAVKYGNEECLSVCVELSMEDGFARIQIKDNGPGIPEDRLPYIFDRFYRIDLERTKDLMSTGLGLAIAKELVESHKGKIMVSSIEGQGSCFTIMLPVVR
ncbi:signal transduction histidine kinase [Anaerosolibacter carboniphilus]|uniref:histidine kinase n=1 Tax=Anaerosolibacter carboniphilus TaxID=1417629 RepID=A0A841KZS2_9FIRM|nr:HAMP domain-containing sensor histidine kinase [Anaerosolibacter carboniphilus]MBB6217470.1 signal transduction histidine kinase [Anaerosolibacter carboniphilus]